MPIVTLSGDLLDQPVEAIVNAWNRNIAPWWLLRPHGVSGAIKRHAGVEPFRELARYGRPAPGQAVLTDAGRLPFRAIIHVAAITPWGRSNGELIRDAARNALALARDQGFTSLAYRALSRGATVVVINLDVVDDASRQLYKINAPAGRVLPALVAAAWPGER